MSRSGVRLIADERLRQMREEGYTVEHDSEHIGGELADAAAAYAVTSVTHSGRLWPFEAQTFKGKRLLPESEQGEARIRELTKAGALIAAEIDRLVRAAGVKGP